MSIENVLLLVGILALILAGCNIWLLVEYLYHKKVIDKLRKLCIRELIAPEAIIECCEPLQGKEQCGSVSRREGFTCNRRRNHEGIHIATDFFKILGIWEDTDAVQPVDVVPESATEETQQISRKWTFAHRRGKR